MCDKSKRPKTIHTKITPQIEEKIIKIRKETGWGQERITDYVSVSHWSVNKILNKYNLTSPSKERKKETNMLDLRENIQTLCGR